MSLRLALSFTSGWSVEANSHFEHSKVFSKNDLLECLSEVVVRDVWHLFV